MLSSMASLILPEYNEEKEFLVYNRTNDRSLAGGCCNATVLH